MKKKVKEQNFPSILFLWRRKWQPTPVFFPRKSHGQRTLVGYSPWGHKESDSNWAHYSFCVHAKEWCPTATLWTVALQALPSMGFSRQEHWNRFPCPPPGDLPNPGLKTWVFFISCIVRWVVYHWSHLGSPFFFLCSLISQSFISLFLYFLNISHHLLLLFLLDIFHSW